MRTAGAANILPAGRRRRALMGVVALAVAVAALGLLLAGDASRGWRALLLVPFWLGTLGLVQARRHT
jgi:hypothetical protein